MALSGSDEGPLGFNDGYLSVVVRRSAYAANAEDRIRSASYQKRPFVTPSAKTNRLDPARRLVSAFIPGAGTTSCLRVPEAIDGLWSVNSCGWSQADDSLPSIIPGFQPFSKPRRAARETAGLGAGSGGPRQ